MGWCNFYKGVQPVALRLHLAQEGYKCNPIQNREFT